MKLQLLLLWTLTAAFVSCTADENEIKVAETGNGIKLSCKTRVFKTSDPTINGTAELSLEYKDENSGEYYCENNEIKIFVKFRTCDNCIELDMPSLAGLVIGDVVATLAVGVAVYLIASKARTSPNTTTKKRSDRQHLVQNEVRNRSANDHYQPLRSRQAQGRDEYDVLRT